MAKGRLAPPQGPQLRDLVSANGARDQIRDVDLYKARILLSGVVGLISHGAPPSPAASW